MTSDLVQNYFVFPFCPVKSVYAIKSTSNLFQMTPIVQFAVTVTVYNETQDLG